MDSSSAEDAPPSIALRHASGRAVDVAWRNESGGMVWRIDHGAQYLKWSPTGVPGDLADEAARLRWAGDHIRVPRVIDIGVEPDGKWMLTEGIPAQSAISGAWPVERVVRSLAVGLRHLHDRLPVEACPWTWDARGRQVTEEALALGPPPPIDLLVVCHGDNCAPNTLLSPDGEFVAHVDFDQLGSADRWADIGTALWSLEFNFGPGWDSLWYEAYGIDRDPAREAFYRALWQVG